MTDSENHEGTLSRDIERYIAEHAEAAARRAKTKLGGPLNLDVLERFLCDPDCVRYPVEIVFDAGPLEDHQFAELVIVTNNGIPSCRLHVHPRFTGCDEALLYFVSYMAGVINYGTAATPDLCEAYGAALLEEDRETFYQNVCAFAGTSPMLDEFCNAKS